MKKLKTVVRHLSFVYNLSANLGTLYRLFILFFATVVVRTQNKNYLQSEKTYDINIARGKVHTITLRPADYFILFEIFGLKIYEEFVEKVSESGSIIDLGGHIGLASLFFRAHLNNPIHVFEPSPINLVLLRKNVAELSDITVHDKAVSDSRGPTILHIYETKPSRNSLKEETKGRPTTPVTVETVTLDDILEQENKVAGIKFDIEGMEYDVFKNSTKSSAVPYLLGEIKIDEKFSMDDFLKLFPNHKTQVTDISRNTYVVSLTL